MRPWRARGRRRRPGDPHPVTRRRRRRNGTARPRVAGGRDVVGARLYLRDLEDTRIPEGNPTIAMIEDIVAEIEPTVVYTHSVHDLHQDHRSVHRAAMVACRRVSKVYCYQSPSATVDYRPTHFVTVDDYIGRKLKLIDAFGSQAGIRDYLEPELIRATARYWSRYGTGAFAEPFETVERPQRHPAKAAGRLGLGRGDRLMGAPRQRRAAHDAARGPGRSPGCSSPGRRPRGHRRDAVARRGPDGRAARRGHGPVGVRPVPPAAGVTDADPAGGGAWFHRRAARPVPGA